MSSHNRNVICDSCGVFLPDHGAKCNDVDRLKRIVVGLESDIQMVRKERAASITHCSALQDVNKVFRKRELIHQKLLVEIQRLESTDADAESKLAYIMSAIYSQSEAELEAG